MAMVGAPHVSLDLSSTRGLAPRLAPGASARRRAARCTAAQDCEGPSTSGRAPMLPPAQKVPYTAILALASAGAAETAYLTAAKLTGASVACPLSGGCASVLTSEYAQLLGVLPLSAVGVLGYGGVAALAAAGRRAAAAGADERLHLPLLLGGLGLASCSSYLLYILVSQFPGELCPWCLGSAALSFGIAALAASGLRRRELEDAAAPGAGLVATTLLVLSLGLGNPESSLAGSISELAFKEPEIATESSPRAVGLAKRLSAAGARMYGAFWCSHCFDQKETFGAAAMRDFPYVECFPNGWRKGEDMADACKAAGLEGFPTWVVGGQRLVGEQSFDELEAALAALAPAAPALDAGS